MRLKDHDFPTNAGNAFFMSFTMLLSDLFMLCLGMFSGFLVVSGLDPSFGLVSIWSIAWILPVVALVFFACRLYPPVCMAPADELKRIMLGGGFVLLICVVIDLALRQDTGSIISILVGYPLCICLILAGRWAVRSLCEEKTWWGVPVVIIGAGDTGRMIVDRLLEWPRLGLRPVFLFDDDSSVCGKYRGIPIVFGTTDAAYAARDNHVKFAIVAMPGVARDRVMQIIDETIRFFPYMMLVPDMFGMSSMWVSTRDLNGILTLEAQQRLIMPSVLAAKRALDLFMSVLGGILVLPFILLIAVWIKLDSRGSVFYGHERLGKDGRPFKAWKFRSMVLNADKVLKDYLEAEPAMKKEWEENFKLKVDPRITRVGRFLRRTSLDELPQVWNVVMGEMSFVGPRPIVRDEVVKYGSKYELFASVKPGITGLWQISGRNDIDYAERVELDIYYVRNWSIWLDLYIFLKTFLVVLQGLGAY